MRGRIRTRSEAKVHKRKGIGFILAVRCQEGQRLNLAGNKQEAVVRGSLPILSAAMTYPREHSVKERAH